MALISRRARTLAGEGSVPGDKSISHRARGTWQLADQERNYGRAGHVPSAALRALGFLAVKIVKARAATLAGPLHAPFPFNHPCLRTSVISFLISQLPCSAGAVKSKNRGREKKCRQVSPTAGRGIRGTDPTKPAGRTGWVRTFEETEEPWR